MGIRKRLRILVIAVLPLVAGLGVEVAASTPAFALGQGSACMFNAPNAAAGFGHVGWAFEVGSSGQWVFGSTDDNAAGDPYVPPGQYNGAWSRSGSFSAGLAAFRASSIGYTRYRCVSTPTSAVGAAVQQANAASGWGYTLIGNNCLDHTYRILTTYRGGIMSPPSLTIIPDDAFVGGLSHDGWGPIISL